MVRPFTPAAQRLGRSVPSEVLKCNPARAGSTDSLDLRPYATDAKHRARLPKRDFALRLVKEKKVAVVPGGAFTADQRAIPNFRITFSALTEGQIARGIEAIGQLVDEG